MGQNTAPVDLDEVFRGADAVDSSRHLEDGGFKIIHDAPSRVIVATHKAARGYVFKLYGPNVDLSYSEQARRFEKRVNGARLLREHIATSAIHGIVVPRKWLCTLPSRFDAKKGPTRVVIADHMDVLDKDESARRYDRIHEELLAELCSVLFSLGGLDFTPRNAPFTENGKIAWIDTDHVKRLKAKIAARRKSFDKNIHRVLSGKNLRRAEALWKILVARSELR